MKLSTKGRYGLRAMIDIALYNEKEPVPICKIAERQNLSERYLEQLVSLLRKNGLIRSVRGAGGGYVLARDASEISAGDVLRALEGSLEPVDCDGFNPDGECEAAGECVTKYVWRKINESINRTVDEIKLDALVKESRQLSCSDGSHTKKCDQ